MMHFYDELSMSLWGPGTEYYMIVLPCPLTASCDQRGCILRVTGSRGFLSALITAQQDALLGAGIHLEEYRQPSHGEFHDEDPGYITCVCKTPATAAGSMEHSRA